MADRVGVDVSLVGGGQVRIEELSQIEGTAVYVIVRDLDGHRRVVEFSDPEALTEAIRNKLRRALETLPPEEPAP